MQQESSASIQGFARHFPRGWLATLVASWLAASLGAAFLNLSTATLRRAGGLVSLERILLALASAVLVSLLIYLGLSIVALLVTRLTHRRRFIPMILWSDFTLLAIATLAPVWNLVNENLPSGGWAPAERLMTSTSIWATAFTLPLIAAVAAAAWHRKRHIARTYRAWLLTAPLLGFQVFVFVWTQVHWVSGIVSLGSLLVTLLFLLGVFATLAAGTWLSGHVRVVPALTAVTVLILLAPIPGLLQSSRPLADSMAAGQGTSPISCVVLLTIDTLRADSLGPLHHELPPEEMLTPELDALTHDSILFTQARSSSPWTKPATASILTGLSREVHRADELRSVLPSQTQTLAEHLQGAGFTTAGIGRNTFLRHSFNFNQGFDEYNFFPRGNSGILGDRLLRSTLPRLFATKPSSQELTDFAVHWLRRHAEQRFFLWLHYFDPHGPFTPPAEYLPQRPMQPRIGNAFDQTQAVRSGELVPDLEEREWIRQLYLAETRHVSRQVGRVVDILKAIGRYDACLVVLTSDHGEEFWEHGGFEHGHTLYDELLRVPLAFKLPEGLAAPRRIEQPVSTASVTPTVLDILGSQTPPHHFSAPSLVPYWQGETTPPEAPIFASGVHYFEDREAVLFDGHKYIYVPLTGQEQLFDLRRDPGETRNLVLERSDLRATARRYLAEHAKASRQMRQRLGIDKEMAEELDSDTLQDLRSLGYLQ